MKSRLLFVFSALCLVARVLGQPVITKQPQPQSIVVGGGADFSVEATGTPPLTYQWRAYTTTTAFTDIPDATGSTLHLTDVRVTGRRYAVVVSDEDGSVTSQLATLTVVYPPSIIDPPLTQFAWVGRGATLKVSFTNTTPMSYQWQRNGVDMPNKTSRYLTFSNLQRTDDADYRVIVQNPAGSATSATAHLTVRDMPPPTGASFINSTALETSVMNMMRAHAVPGASLAIMKDGRLILARGFGIIDPENSDNPVQPDSLFAIASLSKAITATVVLKLVDEGRINLDDPVFPLLNLPPPTFPGAKLDARLATITLRQCLNMTAGWNRETAKNPNGGTGFDPLFWYRRPAEDLGITTNLAAHDTLLWMTGFPLQTSPGSVFYYSNGGYTVAGALIEKITGRSYEEAVRSLLAPAGITRLWIADRSAAGRRSDEVVRWLSPSLNVRTEATSIEFPPAITQESMRTQLPVAPGAGGWVASAMDYARFITTIDGAASPPDVISPNGVKTMLTVTPQSRGAGEPYGMGWEIDEFGGKIFHTGALYAGTIGRALRRKDGAVGVVLCSTYDTSLGEELLASLEAGLAAVRTWPTKDLFPTMLSQEAWQAQHFTPAELGQPEISGDDADPDGDGISNLVEYAGSSDPQVASQEPWLQGRLVGEGDAMHFVLDYRRRPLGHAVAYDLEASSDLKAWQPANAAATTERLQDDGMVAVTVTDGDTIATSAPRFFRLTVSRVHTKQ